MRTYGKVETTIWQNAKFRKLSHEAQRLFLYLITCPHGSTIGCFILPVDYMAADLDTPREQVEKLVAELVVKRMIERDGDLALTRIIGWWGHNTIENPNVAKAALSASTRLPRCQISANAVNALIQLGNRFVEPFTNQLQNLFKNEYRIPEPEPEPIPEPEPEPEGPSLRSGLVDDAALAPPDPPAPTKPDCKPIMDAWNELAKATGLPAILSLSDARKALVRARLRTHGPDGFATVFAKVRASPRLLGQRNGSGHEGWRATFDWVVTERNWLKILEKNFDEHAQNGQNSHETRRNGPPPGGPKGPISRAKLVEFGQHDLLAKLERESPERLVP